MTDTGTPADLASLEPLEPLAATPEAAAAADPLAANRGGLPAPAFNMYCTDKSMYRFLFAGVVMFVGCMMPFSAELARAGYQTMSGGFYTLIAIAMVWSWWASIANNRPIGLKWLLVAALPAIAAGWTVLGFDPAQAAETARSMGYVSEDLVFSASWGDAFGDMFKVLKKDPDPMIPLRVEGFWRLLGPGNVLVFLGALLAEVGFVMGVVGGAKQNKQATRQKQMKAAERRRK